MLVIVTSNYGTIKFDSTMHSIWMAVVDNDGEFKYFISVGDFRKAMKSYKDKGYKIHILKK